MQLVDNEQNMITVDEAKKKVIDNCCVLNMVEMAIENAVGFALAADIFSSINIPAFRQSSMDGYAIRLQDITETLSIQDELPAGTPRQIVLMPQQAIKVFTGGPVPEGADVVVQKELVTIQGNSIHVNTTDIEAGANIRMPGSEIGEGVLAIPKGTVITYMQVAYLASLGITTVQVFRKPSVAIIITGNELVQPGNPLLAGQLYESNSFGLRACLQKAGVNAIHINYAKDNLKEIEIKISEALTAHDIVLLTGGVSVGDYDFVSKACLNQGVQQQFHGVKQKPGKPLFFGTKGEKLIFGLPGNPASVLSCYQQYVLPAINHLSAVKEPRPLFAGLKQLFEKKAPLTFFLKGYYENGSVTILSAQASFQLSAFVTANCWVELDEAVNKFEEHQQVKIHMFV